jgi:hypothetical protein
VEFPEHVVERRRDGRRYILLHRSVGFVDDDKVEIRSARSTLLLPIVGLLTAGGAGFFLAARGMGLPLWLLVVLLLFCLLVVPASVMGIISSAVGAEVVVDRRKGSVSWQQGALGMGIGAREVAPFPTIDHLEVTIEGDEADRWHGEADSIRQFALVLVKKNKRRLELARIPVAAGNQADGMDRTLALGNAIANVVGVPVQIPEGWEMVTIDTETGEIKEPPKLLRKPKPARSRARR